MEWIGQVDPDHHRVQRQRCLAAHDQAERGAGVVVQHAEDPPRRVVPRPAHDGLAQQYGGDQEQAVVGNDRQVGLDLQAGQQADQHHVEDRAGGHDQSQVGLVQLGILLELHVHLRVHGSAARLFLCFAPFVTKTDEGWARR